MLVGKYCQREVLEARIASCVAHSIMFPRWHDDVGY
jgi:hypothetical protein